MPKKSSSSLRSLAVEAIFKQFDRKRTKQRGRPDYPHSLLPPPIIYFENLVTGFVDRINPANEIVDRNRKFPKHCDTV